jgi:hypothetical protein
MPQNATVQRISAFAMLTSDHPEYEADDGIDDARPPCTALVPVCEPRRHARPLRRLSLPDPTFLAHLLATVAQLPQTRQYRRAAQADALSAYRAPRSRAPETGFRTRQII